MLTEQSTNKLMIPPPEEDIPNNDADQPEWMEVVRPNSYFDELSTEFSFDDGGPEHDWSKTSNDYPDDFGAEWWDNITKAANIDESFKIPQVDLQKMNNEQKLAFNIVMKTLFNYTT